MELCDIRKNDSDYVNDQCHDSTCYTLVPPEEHLGYVSDLPDGAETRFTWGGMDTWSTLASRGVGICGPPALFCGDGTKTAAEDCDDGNENTGDGCTGNCLLERTPSILLTMSDNLDNTGKFAPAHSGMATGDATMPAYVDGPGTGNRARHIDQAGGGFKILDAGKALEYDDDGFTLWLRFSLHADTPTHPWSSSPFVQLFEVDFLRSGIAGVLGEYINVYICAENCIDIRIDSGPSLPLEDWHTLLVIYTLAVPSQYQVYAYLDGERLGTSGLIVPANGPEGDLYIGEVGGHGPNIDIDELRIEDRAISPRAMCSEEIFGPCVARVSKEGFPLWSEE